MNARGKRSVVRLSSLAIGLVAVSMLTLAPTSTSAAPASSTAKAPKATAKAPRKKPKKDAKPQGKPGKEGGKTSGSAPPPAPPAAPKVVVDAPLGALPDPAIVEARADAGLGISIATRPDLGTSVIALRLPFGAASDPESQGGLVAITARAIADAAPTEREAFRGVGGSESFEVEADAVTFVLRQPASQVGAAMALLDTQLRSPIAPASAELARTEVSGTSLDEDARALTLALAYQGYCPYEHRARGSEAYLAKVDLAGVESTRKTRFVLAGAKLAVVGPVDADAVTARAKEIFHGPAAEPLGAPAGALAEQTNQRASDVQEGGAPTALHYAWALPRATPAELEELEVMTAWLGEGGHLGDALAKGGFPSRVRASLERRIGPSVLSLDVELPLDADVGKAKKAIDEVLADAGKHGPAPADLARAKHALWGSRAGELDDPVALALRIARGDESLVAERARLESLKADDLPAIAARFLGPLTRSLVETRDPARPKAKPASAGQSSNAAAAPVVKAPEKDKDAKKPHNKKKKP
jgi:predicted Zn-dependent peptidase